jgi:hypothetical protein
MIPAFAIPLAIAVSGVVAHPMPQVPQGTASDPFGPNGALGGLLHLFGNITNGPAPKGCSKYEILVGESVSFECPSSFLQPSNH